MDKNIIFYFSGTGNSLHAARTVSHVLPDCDLEFIPTSQTTVLPAGCERVGFVFPVYYGAPPMVVQTFLDRLRIEPASPPYVFGLLTYGGSPGGCEAVLAQSLAKNGIHLDAVFTVPMQANYVALYNVSEMGENMRRKSDQRLQEIARAVQARAISEVAAKDSALMRAVRSRLFPKLRKMDRFFRVADACTGCGVCEKICPVGNVRLHAGRPTFCGECERCMACINACPEKALNCKNRTRKRGRYRHPEVTLSDLLDRKNVPTRHGRRDE